LLEEFALVDDGWRAYAEALAVVEEDNLVGVFGGEVELVGNHDYRVAIFGG
jgi:hypothetical protein